MDGTEVVLRPVQPGETFTYRFTPPDAGTFWYHPHANETEQLEKGLYGALIVCAADELALDGEKILVFDDLRIDKSGQIAKFGGLMDRHNGREGNVRLINGSAEPEFRIAAGQIERWRIGEGSPTARLQVRRSEVDHGRHQLVSGQTTTSSIDQLRLCPPGHEAAAVVSGTMTSFRIWRKATNCSWATACAELSNVKIRLRGASSCAYHSSARSRRALSSAAPSSI